MLISMRWLPDGRVVTLDERSTVRVFRDGHVERSVRLAIQDPSAFAISDDLSTIAIAAKQLVVWRDGKGSAVAATLNRDEPVVYVELAKDRIVSLSTNGQLQTHDVPADSNADAVASWTEHDAEAQAREATLWQVARGERGDAAVLARDQALRAYAAWKQKPSATFSAPVSIDVLERVVDGGYLDDATTFYAAWLARPTAAVGTADDARVKRCGLSLASALSTVDAEQPLLAAMYKRWATDPEVVRRYASTAETTKQTIAILRRAVAKNPHAVELWNALLWETDEAARPNVLAEAKRVLTADELARLVADGPT